MPAARPRSAIIAALDAAFGGFLDLGQSLDDAQWDASTDVPGWTVRDNYSHVLGTELMLLGRPDPEVELPELAHVKNDIAKFNEMSVHQRRDRPGAEVLAEFEAVWTERKAALDEMDDATFEEEGFTPAGKDTYGRFMQIRVFDCWIHEQDVRTALDLPGHDSGPAVETAIDEMTASMGFVVGKKAGATEGQSVRLELTGPAARTINVLVDGRAGVVDELPGEPTATVTVPVLTWFRFITGRWDADADRADVSLAGDEDLARRVVESANYTI